MLDREKIESLKQCLSASCRGFRTCPYSDTEWDAIETVLELLAEQEPVKPISAHVWARTYGRCGNCEAPLPAIEGLRSKFCWMCGRKVDWNA